MVVRCVVGSDEVLVASQESATVVMGSEQVLGTSLEPAMVARVDLVLSVGLVLVAEVFGGAWRRKFIWSTTWHTIPRISSRIRKAVDVGGWLGCSVVAEFLQSESSRYSEESHWGWWFFINSYRWLARRTSVVLKQAPALNIAEA